MPLVKNSVEVGAGTRVPSASLQSTSSREKVAVPGGCYVYTVCLVTFFRKFEEFLERTGPKHNLQDMFK